MGSRRRPAHDDHSRASPATVVGGFIAGTLLGIADITGFNLTSLLVAVFGAVVVISVARLVMGRGVSMDRLTRVQHVNRTIHYLEESGRWSKIRLALVSVFALLLGFAGMATRHYPEEVRLGGQWLPERELRRG